MSDDGGSSRVKGSLHRKLRKRAFKVKAESGVDALGEEVRELCEETDQLHAHEKRLLQQRRYLRAQLHESDCKAEEYGNEEDDDDDGKKDDIDSEDDDADSKRPSQALFDHYLDHEGDVQPSFSQADDVSPPVAEAKASARSDEAEAPPGSFKRHAARDDDNEARLEGCPPAVPGTKTYEKRKRKVEHIEQCEDDWNALYAERNKLKLTLIALKSDVASLRKEVLMLQARLNTLKGSEQVAQGIADLDIQDEEDEHSGGGGVSSSGAAAAAAAAAGSTAGAASDTD